MLRRKQRGAEKVMGKRDFIMVSGARLTGYENGAD
jgi:hypothetical protein